MSRDSNQSPDWVTPSFTVIVGMLVFAPIVWGSNRPLPLMVLQLGAVVVLVAAAWRGGVGEHLARSHKVVLVCLAAFPLVYLIPVPAAAFGQLPGRDLYLEVLRLVGAGEGWHAISVFPLATEAAWLTLLVPIAVFVGAMALPQRQLHTLVLVLLVMAAAEAALGLVQYGDGPESVFRFGHQGHADSAIGTYANRNHLAGMLEMTLPVALGLLAAAVGKHRGTARRGRLDRLYAGDAGAVLLGAAAILILLGLIFTRSRAGLFLAMLGIVFSLMIYARRLGGSGMGVVGTFSAIGVGLAALVGLTPVLQRFTSQDALSDIRFTVFESVWRGVGQFFPLGSGPGTFPHVYPRFQPPELDYYINHAHNDYLEWLMEGGLLAAALLAAIVFLYLRRWPAMLQDERWPAFRFAQVGAGIGIFLLLLHGLVDFNLHIPANAVVLALLAAVFFQPPARHPRPTRRTDGERQPAHIEQPPEDERLAPLQGAPEKVVNPFAE